MSLVNVPLVNLDEGHEENSRTVKMSQAAASEPRLPHDGVRDGQPAELWRESVPAVACWGQPVTAQRRVKDVCKQIQAENAPQNSSQPLGDPLSSVLRLLAVHTVFDRLEPASSPQTNELGQVRRTPD
jgi:hypothetical protein